VVGENVLVLLGPTITVNVCWAETATAGTRAATTVEKRILREESRINDYVVRLVYLKSASGIETCSLMTEK